MNGRMFAISAVSAAALVVGIANPVGLAMASRPESTASGTASVSPKSASRCVALARQYGTRCWDMPGVKAGQACTRVGDFTYSAGFNRPSIVLWCKKNSGNYSGRWVRV